MTDFISDWLVLTPLSEEWKQLIEAVPPDLDGRWDDATPSTWRWRIPIARQRPLLAAGTYVDVRTPGQAVTGVEATRLIEAFRPRSVALVGIAGAFDEQLALGDVVIPDLVFGYTTGTVDDAPSGPRRTVRRATVAVGGPLIRAAQDFINHAAYHRWQHAGRDHAERLGLVLPDGSPRAHTGIALASGNEVVRSTGFADELKQALDSRISCVAMEEVGCFEAIDSLDVRSALLVVRGISDRADPNKVELEKASRDAWRKLAAANAARFWRMMVEHRAEASVQPALHLEPERAAYQDLDRLFARAVLRRPGVQHLGFHVLQLGERRPPMRLVMTTHGTERVTARVKIGGGDTSVEIKLAPRSDHGLECNLPGDPAGRLTILIHAEPAIAQLELRIEDYFGRVAAASLPIDAS